MTFCLGINVQEGLIGIADTRITSGNECLTARKVSVYEQEQGAMFVMTSGLRSVRDKALTYFEEAWEEREEPFTRLYEAVNLFAAQVRRVAEEDREPLERAGLSLNVHALIGGQMSKDRTHKLYLMYPEGNWVDTSRGHPLPRDWIQPLWEAHSRPTADLPGRDEARFQSELPGFRLHEN